MGRERSHVRKRRRGCLSGCLTNILLLLGLAALLFVGACVMGFVKNDPETGAPSLSLENVGLGALPEIHLPAIQLPQDGLLEGLSLPSWAYGVPAEGMTVKTLRAGEGEAVLVCCDGYTMLVGAGGSGPLLGAQLLLCGVTHLGAAVATGAAQEDIGGMATVIGLARPDYLLFQDTQTKGKAYNAMLEAAEKTGRTQAMAARQGLTFSLGRGTVTVVGPASTAHTDERDDGLSLRVDYGATSVLIMGSVTARGEQELALTGAPLSADALIAARGGSDEGTCLELVNAVQPGIALLTGKNPANPVKIRLQKAGAEVYTAQEHGVMTLVSDGQTLRIEP